MRRRKHAARVDWTFVRDDGRAIYCARCGGEMPVVLPMAGAKLCEAIAAFNAIHADCEGDGAGSEGPPPGSEGWADVGLDR
jgi:hypothetical protein